MKKVPNVFGFVFSFFRPSAAVSRDDLLESCMCRRHCRCRRVCPLRESWKWSCFAWADQKSCFSGGVHSRTDNQTDRWTDKNIGPGMRAVTLRWRGFVCEFLHTTTWGKLECVMPCCTHNSVEKKNCKWKKFWVDLHYACKENFEHSTSLPPSP